MFDITPVHLHLLVNHVPVIGSVAAVFLVIWSMIRNNAELKRTALITCVLVGAATFVADQTGDGASEVAHHIAAIDRARIKEHSQSADYANMTSDILAVIALVGLVLAARKKDPIGPTTTEQFIRHHKEPHKAIMILCLLVGLFDLTVLSRTAYLGGEIRHPEIVPGYQTPQSAPDSVAPQPN